MLDKANILYFVNWDKILYTKALGPFKYDWLYIWPQALIKDSNAME